LLKGPRVGAINDFEAPLPKKGDEV